MITYEAIGYLRCKEQYRFETPRQGVLANNEGVIELKSGLNYEQGLKDLELFDYIWVIYDLHLNKNWKPMVTPPRNSKNSKSKKGLFATRSPHRPNSIGMSCVKLVKIEKCNITIANFDILNDTPILDIKPYIKYCDSFPDASTGWLPSDGFEEIFKLKFSDISLKQLDFIKEHTSFDIKSFVEVQLSTTPTDSNRKRIKEIKKNDVNQYYELSYRTWRILYQIAPLSVNEKNSSHSTIEIIKIYSGYSNMELKDIENDKYKDKATHNIFNTQFII